MTNMVMGNMDRLGSNTDNMDRWAMALHTDLDRNTGMALGSMDHMGMDLVNMVARLSWRVVIGHYC